MIRIAASRVRLRRNVQKELGGKKNEEERTKASPDQPETRGDPASTSRSIATFLHNSEI